MNTNPDPQRMPVSTDDYVHHLGIGAELGEPFGFTTKYWLTDMFALDGAVGWSPAPHSTAEIHADFLAHDFDLFSVPQGKLPAYVGGGIFGRFRDDGRSDLGGFRFPLGVSYMLENCPIDVFAEVAPEIIFSPFARGGVDGVVGFRYWF